MTDQTRREFVSAAVAGAAIATWLRTDHALVAQTAQQAQRAPAAERYLVLSPVQVKELDAVTSTLVPTDGTPGAHEAKVVRFIDRSLSSWAKDQRPQVDGALTALREFVASRNGGNGSFAALAPAARVETLEAFEKEKPGEFNGGFWFPTMAGMFTNPEYGGNANKVGWSLMGFRDQFSWTPPFGYYDRG